MKHLPILFFALVCAVFAGCASRMVKNVVEPNAAVSKEPTIYKVAEVIQAEVCKKLGRDITITLDTEFYEISIPESITNDVAMAFVQIVENEILRNHHCFKRIPFVMEMRHILAREIEMIIGREFNWDSDYRGYYNFADDNFILRFCPKGLVLHYDPEGFDYIPRDEWKTVGTCSMVRSYDPCWNLVVDIGEYVIATPEFYKELLQRRADKDTDEIPPFVCGGIID